MTKRWQRTCKRISCSLYDKIKQATSKQSNASSLPKQIPTISPSCPIVCNDICMLNARSATSCYKSSSFAAPFRALCSVQSIGFSSACQQASTTQQNKAKQSNTSATAKQSKTKQHFSSTNLIRRPRGLGRIHRGPTR